MATTADFRNGLVIEFNNDLYVIVQFQHVKPGKGPAFVRTKLKNIKTGRVIDNTFNSGVKVNVARVERRPYQYLYKDDIGYYFMHLETFEQIHVEEHVIDYPEFLLEGQNVEIVVHADTDNILSVELPQFVTLEVTYSEPGLRGDTATNTLKQAKTENGVTVMVPLFVNTGDKIRVEVSSKAYIERVKG
ncbi:MAG TPA: elongation factor P [Bacteroidales bacterium]|nr:elongation factor P [Bacteroidales bacterium]HPI69103.1 elongation factor P [Bacteroidales bacterium]HPR12243.1 elongation factor P [Bacteroidales bacterium]HRW83907.1 elongation factor P [Bacteroidales bacterium]